MAVRVTPEEFQEKHSRRTKAALDDMRKGVEAVAVAPGAEAAKAKRKWADRMSSTAVHDKWARRVGGVSLEDWKLDMLEKGVGRVSAGLDRATGKVIAFAAQLIPYQNALLVELEKMPDVTLEDSIARATSWIRKMAAFERK